MSRQLNIRAGRDGLIQRFSVVYAPSPAITTEVLGTLKPSTHARVRDQTLFDPTKCSQFLCVFGDTVGFLTRPTLVDNPETAIPSVVGSFSDRIGTCIPVAVTLAAFQGSFTTLVPRAMAETFQLPCHPTDPDLVDGPPIPPAEGDAGPPQAVPATLARLHFIVGDNPTPADRPKIVALPNFFPVPLGLSLPESVNIMDPASYAAAPECFRMWIQGFAYAKQYNDSKSVTQGGPLFHLPDLALLDGVADPFAAFNILDDLPANPLMLPPTTPTYHATQTRLQQWADDAWAFLGSQRTDTPAPETPPQFGTNGSTREFIEGIVTPLLKKHGMEKSSKEQEQVDSAKDVMIAYQLALAAIPENVDDATDATAMVIPTLHPEFEAILTKTKPVAAAQALQEYLRGCAEVAWASDVGIDCDVTFDAEIVTTAFANAIRSFHVLTEPLARTTKSVAQQRLGLLHFLTPIRGILMVQKGAEAANNPIVLSHVTDDKAQLEASKSSMLYASGRLESNHDVYLAVCNLRLVILAMLKHHSPVPLLLKKLLAYVNVFRGMEGRLWADTHKLNLGICVHIFQDLQHILGMFFSLGKRSNLKNAIKSNCTIAPKNFWNAARTADSLIDRLRSIITGNHLGQFHDPPVCLPWFAPTGSSVPQTPTKQPRDQSNTPSPRNGTPTNPGAPKKSRTKDQAEIDRQKTMGMLLYDAQVGGNSRLPHCPLYGKARKTATSDERFCMQFMTVGHFCSRANCPFPHVASLARLSKEDKDAFVAWVDKTKGLSFAPGKGPAGTP